MANPEHLAIFKQGVVDKGEPASSVRAASCESHSAGRNKIAQRFQRWVAYRRKASPTGTAEIRSHPSPTPGERVGRPAKPKPLLMTTNRVEGYLFRSGTPNGLWFQGQSV